MMNGATPAAGARLALIAADDEDDDAADNKDDGAADNEEDVLVALRRQRRMEAAAMLLGRCMKSHDGPMAREARAGAAEPTAWSGNTVPGERTAGAPHT